MFNANCREVKMNFCMSQDKGKNFFFESKHLQKNLIKKLNDAHVVKEPFPHIFINNFLPNDLRNLLITTISELEFKKFYEGAVPVYHLTDESPATLLHFKDNILNRILTPFFNVKFEFMDLKKNIELNNIFGSVGKSDEVEYASIYFARNPARGRIKMHLDDNFASFQYVFYFGYEDGGVAPTTDLLLSPRSNSGECSDDLTTKHCLNYGSTNNGLLVFANTADSYHGLLTPLTKERWTLCVSAHYYHKNT